MRLLGNPRRKTLHPDKIAGLHEILSNTKPKRRRVKKPKPGESDGMIQKLAYDLHAMRRGRYLPPSGHKKKRGR